MEGKRVGEEGETVSCEELLGESGGTLGLCCIVQGLILVAEHCHMSGMLFPSTVCVKVQIAVAEQKESLVPFWDVLL